jgi:hypothetical protein
MSSSRILVPALAVLAAIPLAAMDSSDVQIHGFVSQGYMRTTNNELYGQETTKGTFSFNEFGVNVMATPIERVRVGVQLFSNSLGDFGRNEVKVDWAYGEYQLPVTGDNSLAVSAGRIKTSHGLYNDYRDLDMTRTSVFLPESVYSASFRDFFLAVNGAGANGTLAIGSLGSLDANAWVGTQEINNEYGPIPDIYLTQSFVASVKDINVDRLQGGGLAWNTPVDGLRFKGSLLSANHLVADMVAKQTSFGPGVNIPAGAKVTSDVLVYTNFIVGGEYQVGNFTFASEYSNSYWKASTDTTLTVNLPTPPFPVGSTTTAPFNAINYSRQHGGYMSGSYRFLPKWEAGTSLNMLYEADGSGNPAADKRNWIALSLRYDVTDHFLIKAEFERSKGYLGTRSGDQTQAREEYWNLMAIKTTFDF